MISKKLRNRLLKRPSTYHFCNANQLVFKKNDGKDMRKGGGVQCIILGVFLYCLSFLFSLTRVDLSGC